MAEEGWYPDPTGRAGQRWHDGARWTDHVISPDGDQGTDPFSIAASAEIPRSATGNTGSQPPSGAGVDGGVERERRAISPVGVLTVAVGVMLAFAGFFVLDWGDGGTSFGDIRDAADALMVDSLAELYIDFAAFGGLACAVILGGLAAVARSGAVTRSTLSVLGAAAAGAAAVYHSYSVTELFAGPADPSFGAWAPAIGYLIIVAGLVIAPLTAQRSGSTNRTPAIGAALVGAVAIIAVIGTIVVADGDATADLTASPDPAGSGSGQSPTPADASGAGDTVESGGADDAALEGLMSILDGDNGMIAGAPSFGTPAAHLGEFLDSAGNGGQRTVRLKDDVIEVCGAGLGSACLELSNFILDDSGFSIEDMDVNGERLSARLRYDATAVPAANPNGVISITSQGQLAVPGGPTIVVLILKQYDERLAQNNGCDGTTATLSTAGPSTTHQGGGADKGSFLGNSMVINFPTTASVGGTLEMDCYTAEGATEHHTVQLPG